MAILTILKYGDPRLSEPGEPVTRWTSDLDTLVADMLETMYYARGVGLAATQVGVLKRLFVADVSGGKNPDEILVVLNPEIVETAGEEKMDEGCLSVPGIYAPVVRPYRVKMRGTTPSGEPREWEAEGFLARAFLHEVDHLNGRLFIDRLTPFNRRMVLKKIAKKKRAREWD